MEVFFFRGLKIQGTFLLARGMMYWMRIEPILPSWKKGIRLTQGQKVWYSHMKQTQGDLMKQEYPSTPEEALWPHVTGAIYGTAMHKLRAQGRVGVKFPVEPGYPLVSAWDLGINDATAIWAAQVVGYELRWRKFYQSSGKELAEYAEVIRAWERDWE